MKTVVNTTKNHDFLISRHRPMFLSCRSWFFMVLLVFFYNVSEPLTMKTVVNTTKNHDFLISRYNLKIMFFCFLLAVPMFLSSRSWFFMVFIGFLQCF